jgi:hypothetical protein
MSRAETPFSRVPDQSHAQHSPAAARGTSAPRSAARAPTTCPASALRTAAQNRASIRTSCSLLQPPARRASASSLAQLARRAGTARRPPVAGQHPMGTARNPATMAPTNKCLARINKSRTGRNATEKREEQNEHAR